MKGLLLCLLVSQISLSQNLIINSGFESAVSTGWGGCVTEVQFCSVFGLPVPGRMAEIDMVSKPCQTVDSLEIGSCYIVSFQCQRRITGCGTGGPIPSDFNVEINSLPIGSVSLNNTVNGLQTFTFSFICTNAISTLSFNPTGLLNSSACGALIDNISLSKNITTIDAGSNVSFCKGDSILLNVSSFSNVNWSSGTINGNYYSPSVSENIYVQGTNSFGCLETDSFIVEVFNSYNINLNDTLTSCYMDSVILYADIEEDVEWSNDIENNIPFIAEIEGYYYLSFVDSNSCLNFDSIYLNLIELPLIYGGEDQKICIGDSFCIYPVGGISYNWNNNDYISNICNSFLNDSLFIFSGIDSNGCTNFDTVFIEVLDLPNINVGIDQTSCIGDIITLNPLGAGQIVWNNPNVQNNQLNPDTTVTLIGSIIDDFGCENSDTLNVFVVPRPISNFTLIDSNIEINEDFFTVNSSANSNHYTFNSLNCNLETYNLDSSFNCSFSETGNYIIELVASNDFCSDTSTQIVNVFNSEVFIPNVITPNNDGENDFFEVSLGTNDLIEGFIVNRWGNKIIEFEKEVKWDGKSKENTECKEGVYFFVYKIKSNKGLINGNTSVTLIR